MEQLLFGSALLDVQYTQQPARTAPPTRGKGLFLDPCIVSEIARESSELSRFHSAVKREGFVAAAAAGIRP